MAETKARKKALKLDPNEYVEVMNGAPHRLIYRNKQTNSTQEWSEYGEVQLVTIQELMTIRGQQPRMFRDQWMVVLDAEIINFLKLEQFYKNLMSPEELDTFFDKDAQEIKDFLSKASNGARMLIAGRARKLYEEDQLNDIHKIRAVNEVLGIHIADME